MPLYRRFDAQDVCETLFRVGIIDVAWNVQEVGGGEFGFSELIKCRPEIKARNLKRLVTLGMIEHDGETGKAGRYTMTESPLWDWLEGVKTAYGQHDRGEKVSLRDEPPMSQAEWLRVRDWFEGGGRQLMSGGSMLIYLLEGVSGTLLTSKLIPIMHHVPRDERRYWMSVNPLAHWLLLWEGAQMISPVGYPERHFTETWWRRQKSPFWPVIASLKDAILDS